MPGRRPWGLELPAFDLVEEIRSTPRTGNTWELFFGLRRNISGVKAPDLDGSMNFDAWHNHVLDDRKYMKIQYRLLGDATRLIEGTFSIYLLVV